MMREDNALKNLIDLFRQKIDREHDLLNQRANIFLIWQSILITGYTLSKSPTNIFILIIGLLSCLLWLYIGYYSRKYTKYLWDDLKDYENKLPEEERFYTNIRYYRHVKMKPIFKLSVSRIIAYVIPCFWLFTWLVASFLF